MTAGTEPEPVVLDDWCRGCGASDSEPHFRSCPTTDTPMMSGDIAPGPSYSDAFRAGYTAGVSDGRSQALSWAYGYLEQAALSARMNGHDPGRLEAAARAVVQERDTQR